MKTFFHSRWIGGVGRTASADPTECTMFFVDRLMDRVIISTCYKEVPDPSNLFNPTTYPVTKGRSPTNVPSPALGLALLQ